MTNHLAQETSLYLQQHAENPVDWYPWGETALNKAKQENKPILLSIGYSACHWCHVMANESFVDAETAKIMNDNFINIKVDREERPDLDKIYQVAHQLLTGRGGGWPLTMFLSPQDQTPFFGGTYFPLEPRYGMPAFKEILQKVSAFYAAHQNEINEQNVRLKAALFKLQSQVGTQQELNATPITKGQQELEQSFDPRNGGFGAAPKFPHATSLDFLLRNSSVTPHAQSALRGLAPNNTHNIIIITLTKMANGGIYDQIGGGFFRYSVDAAWEIPHFEKMLYDNAQLLVVYAQANLIFKNSFFGNIIKQTVDWSLREMRAPEGGFYATLDADSEHVEGKYYYWDVAEIKNLLTEDEWKIINNYYNLGQHANFEGHWHLHVTHLLNDADNKLLTLARKKLLGAREKRVKPGRDEKIITAWNGLMIKGLALAGFVSKAQQTLEFIKQNLWQNNRLFSTYQNGSAKISGYLDDYVFLLEGIIYLLQAEWSTENLNFAIKLADVLLEQFYDHHNGGFFFTANDHEKLLQRPKTFLDEAVPSANGVAAYCFLILGFLLGEQKYLDAAEKTLKIANQNLIDYPSAHASLLIALQNYLEPPKIIIIRGEKNTMQQWQKLLQKNYASNRLIFSIPADEKNLPESLAVKETKQNKTIAYVCEGLHCSAPIEDIEKLI